MKIAIGRNIPKNSPWVWRGFDDRYPGEIREHIESLIDLEERTGGEIFLMTLNRTVIDMACSKYAKNNCGLSYEDVHVDVNGELAPLLSLHSEEWLSHFALGDLFEYGNF